MAEDPEQKLRATLVRAAREVERLRGKVAELEAATTEPIALIGVGLRLPGGVHDLDELWQLLANEVDAVDVMPRSRWDADLVHDPNPDAPGKSYTREAAFLADIDLFDAAFFNISPREARTIDPQHRMLLESAWQALEHAGIVPATLIDSRTGVFVGFGPSDYGVLQERVGMNDAYEVMGTQMSFSAGRVAFHLGLQGPAFPVATACSSALVALHLACQSLRARECELALVGGVQAMALPDTFVHLSRTRALAANGRCKTFSANADGYGRGEGVVTFALERLSVAQAKDRRILAVIRGSAVNHDGTSSGIMAPNGTSQQKVLRAALSNAGLEPTDIDFVECNGTGTKLGDPIEIQALAAVYALGRARDRPLYIGALKTNIGHLEPASGLAGIAKVIAAMQHRALPATLHTHPRNPHVDWPTLAIEVVDELRAWPRRADDVPLRAGVSAFGMSGTNTHVILEEPPAIPVRATDAVGGPSAIWPMVVSGRDDLALQGQAARLRDYLDAHAEVSALDLAFSLATSRTHFKRRACVVAGSRAGLRDALDALARAVPHAASVGALAKITGKLVFVAHGHAGLAPAAVDQLLARSPAFRQSIEACARVLDPLTGWSLLAALREQTSAASPVSFAIMVSLAAIWRELGVEPDAVLGDGGGQLAAACIAGSMSLEQAGKAVVLEASRGDERARASVFLLADRHQLELGEAIELLLARGHHFFVELGPAPDTSLGLRELLDERRVAIVGSPSRDGDALEQVLLSLGELHCHGYAIDWSALFARYAPRTTWLPTYAFQRQRHWIEDAQVERGPQVRSEWLARVDEAPSRALLELAWEPARAAAPSVAAESRWLILADRHGVAERLAREFVERGAIVDIVPDVNPLDAAAIGPTPLAGLVCLWSIDVEDLAHDAPAAWIGSLQLAHRLATLPLRDPPRLVLVTHRAHAAEIGDRVRPEQSLAWAAGANIRTEYPMLMPLRVDLGELDDPVEIAALADCALASSDEDQILVRGGDRLLARLRRAANEIHGRESVRLAPLEQRTPSAGEVEIIVAAAGFMRRDPNPADGTLLGFDCAGTIHRVGAGVEHLHVGQRVLALAKTWATHVTVDARFVVPIPAELSFSQAAGLPRPCISAWYGLEQVARLRAGERVLILGASEGAGVAALRWARHVGARIHAATTGAAALAWLRAQPVERAMDWQAPSFADEAIADGGFDVVFDNLATTSASPGLDLVRVGGRFVDLGSDAQAPATPNVAYTRIDLEVLAERAPDSIHALLRDAVEHARAGVFADLPIVEHPLSDAPVLLERRHSTGEIGRSVLIIEQAEPPMLALRSKSPRELLKRGASYLITGDVDWTLVLWMAENAAGHFIVVGREHDRESIAAVERAGARVSLVTALGSVLAAIPEHQPLRGVVHGIAELPDRPLAEQTSADFESIVGPEILGAWNLHRLTEDRDLDFFVFNGSVVALLGTPGLARNVALQSACAGIVRHRRSLGLPALALGWGPRSTDPTRTAGLAALLRGRGLGELSRTDVIEQFARLLQGDRDHLAPCRLDAHELVDYYPGIAGWPFLGELLAESPAELSDAAVEFMRVLQAATPGARRQLISTVLLAELAEVLRADPTTIDPDAPFATLGVDSLMGVELRNRIKVETGLEIPATAIWTHPTSLILAEHLATLVGQVEDDVEDGEAEELGTEDATLVVDPQDQNLLDELEGLEDLLDV